MKVTLHIGQSKTGTSAIQSFLTINRKALADQGILYPAASVWGMPVDLGSHNAVADAIAGKVSYPHISAEKYREAFFKEAHQRSLHHMILSAEHFFGGHPRVWDISDERDYDAAYQIKVQRTARWLTGCDVDLIVYLRPHASWLSSGIAQNIRTAGFVANLDPLMSDLEFFEMFRPTLRYERLLSMWRAILAPRTLTVVPYRRDTLINGSSVHDFLFHAGIDANRLPQVSAKHEINPSLTREYLEVRRQRTKTFRSVSEARVATKCLEALSRTSSEPSIYSLSKDALEAVNRLAEEDNIDLMREFGVSVGAASNTLDYPPLNQAKVEEADERFCHEMRRPHYRRMVTAMSIKELLRNHALPLHALLHQVKRAKNMGRR
jgi:hypothetical protein